MKGFQMVPPEQRREIASKGGKAAHESGNAYAFSRESAQRAAKAKWAKYYERKRESLAPWQGEQE